MADQDFQETEVVEFKEGLTWRSLLGMVYASIVFLPGMIWIGLVTGLPTLGLMATTASAAQYACALLFAELARFFGKPLTKQELSIIWQQGIVAGTEAIAITLLFNIFYRDICPIAMMFNAPGTNIPLAMAIPDWWAPPPTSTVILERTLFHTDLLIPMIILMVTVGLSFEVVDVAVGLILYNLLVEEEQLPFPMQVVSAEVINTMSERHPGKMGTLTLCSLIGMVYSGILYGIPLASVFAVQLIPTPWVDLNRYIEVVLPGASLGIVTDLTIFAIGFILPLHVIICTFIGSFAAHFIGNALLVNLFPTPPRGLFNYAMGMSLGSCYQWSILYVWASPMIGLALAAGVIPVIRHPDYIIRAFRTLLRMPAAARRSGALPLWIPLTMFVAGSVGSVVITHILVPGFPVWILLLLSCGWTFFGALISGRAMGETGLSISVPYIKEGAFLASGYSGVDIWYAPIPTSPGGGLWVVPRLKICQLTETKLSSWFKSYYISIALSWILGTVYVQMFWSMGPIPSGAYPGIQALWPSSVAMSALWVTRSLTIFRPEIIAGMAVFGSVLALASDFLHLPFSLIAIVSGLAAPMPVPLSMLIGGIAAKVIERYLSKEWWDDNKYVVVAGLSLGQGVAITVGAAVGLISKSMWIMPY